MVHRPSHLGDDDSGSTDTSGSGGSVLPSWIWSLEKLAKSPRVWLVSTLAVGLSFDEASQRLREGGGPFEVLVRYYLIENFFVPLTESLFAAGTALLDALVLVGWGSDGVIGRTPGSQIGILDIPDVFFSPFIDAVFQFGFSVANWMVAVNLQIGNAVAQGGILAPAIANTLFAVQLGVIGWVVYTAVSVTLSIAQVESVLESLTKAPRVLFSRLFERFL